MTIRALRPYILAVLMTIPGLALHLAPPDISPLIVTALAGMAILGASFLLTWACEVAQMDMPQAVAVAVVAFIAVLPEYAVDMYFTWMAGQHPESSYSHYAIANMTGANRLLIGVGWSAIVLIFAGRFHSAVVLHNDKRTDVLFLAMATIYALIIPLKGSLTWVDGLVLLGIYVWYILIIMRRPVEEEELEGPAAVLARLAKKVRLRSVMLIFVFAAIVILGNAEMFSEGLIASGKMLHVNEFLLVQWIAPLASEAPEFIVALMFASRGNAGLALGCLLSSTLLVLSVIDARTLEIPSGTSIAILVLGAIATGIDYQNWLSHLIGLFAISLPLLLVLLITGGRGIGGGDIKLMAGCGLFLGWKLIILGFFGGCLLGALIHLCLMAAKKAGRTLSFGPYLALGVVLSMLWGDRLISWYVSMFL